MDDKTKVILVQKRLQTKESLEKFKAKFKKKTGIDYEDFRENSVKTTTEDDVDMRYNGFLLQSDAKDGTWTLTKES